jgi:hypothetical protein
MILERFWQVQEELRQAPSTMASAAIAPVHQYRNIAEKNGARAVLHPGAMQTSFTTGSGSPRRERLP